MGSKPQTEDQLAAPVGRRAVVLGAGAVAAAAALAACSTYGKTPEAAPTTAAGGGAGTPLAKTADIPVGSGKIFGDTVVTQATAGSFAAFSSVCTHAGCNVDAVADGTINCPCHGSKYNLDGSVAEGPAQSPLAKKTATVQGDSIVVT